MASAPHIPDYEPLRCIGRGAYGEVWLARSVTGAYRAVKIIYRKSFDHERPYEREFSGIQRYEPVSRSHDTQVEILHVGRNDAGGYFYYVMELADDQATGRDIQPDNYQPWTLRSYLNQNGRVPIQECLDIGLHLAAALDHIHKNGLVHRDVKPSNIVFINRVPKLADIGLVTALDAARSFVGTEGYIPPEGPGSPQADIYSLGKVLYEISTGRNRLDFPELPTLLKDLPEREALVQFNEVVLMACEEDQKLRYHTAAEILKDLWTLKAGKPIRTAPRRAKRWWFPCLIAGLVVALYCGVRLFSNGGILSHRRLVATNDMARVPPAPPTMWNIYRTAFEPPIYRSGQLAGQDGWVLDSHVSANAAKIVQSAAGRYLLVSGFDLEPFDGNNYEVICTRPLDFHPVAANAQHIQLRADVQLTVDPDAARLRMNAVGIGLILPSGSLTNMIWLGRRGGGFAGMEYPGYHQLTAGVSPPPLGFQQLSLDCDLEHHRVTYFLDGHARWVLPFVPNCDAVNARAILDFAGSKPNGTILVVSNLTVAAYLGNGVALSNGTTHENLTNLFTPMQN